MVIGTKSPFLLPTAILPTILIPEMAQWTTGMWGSSSFWKDEKKFSVMLQPTKQ